jgi:hypothetical protein
LRAIAEGQDTIWRYVDVEILPSKLEFKGANLPLPGSFNQNQVQSFAWNPIPGADTYEFQLSSNPHFDNILKPIRIRTSISFSGGASSRNNFLLESEGI